ncbi:TPA: scaffolding protein [Citrobacter freundii]|nr:scaffolding protein [Citrobacter freundii]
MYDTADNNAPENELDTTSEQIPDEVELDSNDEPGDDGDQNSGGDDSTGSDDDSEQTLFFGDEELSSPPSEEDKDPALVKHLRGTIKEKERELKELLRQSQQSAPQQPVITQPPRMPKLDDADIEYDEAVYHERMTKWAEENGKYLEQKRTQEQQQEQLQAVHQQKVANYQQRVKALKVHGYQEAEQAVLDDVPLVIQNAILHESEKPEMVVLALGRNADLRKQLAEATNPVAIGRLLERIESKARLMPKAKTTAATTPEVKGGNGAAINNLDKLREKAEQSGDYTAYLAAKRKAKK